MITSSVVKKALKQEVESYIYSRGLSYFKGGRVGKWLVEEDRVDGVIVITGKVRGSRVYEVLLEFDIKAEIFLELECTCPYGDVCKHIVALTLVFADSLTDVSQSRGIRDTEIIEANLGGDLPSDEIRIRQALRDLGISVETVPKKLLAELLHYRNQTLTPKPIIIGPRKNVDAVKFKPFDPKKYCIILSRYDRYIPTFHELHHASQQASISKVLTRDDLTPAQREILTYIKDGKFERYQSLAPDLAKLFPLLAASGLPVFKNYYSYGDKPLFLDLQPKPLQAEIIYESVPMYGDETRVRHDFFLRMPREYWKGLNVYYDKPFSIHGSCIVRDTKDSMELHQLTPVLVEIVSRLEPVFDYERNDPKVEYFQARLTGDEVSQFDQVVADASRLLALTSEPPLLKSEAVSAKPRTIIQVELDTVEKSMSVVPAMDYGVCTHNISETVFRSRREGGETLSYRGSYEHPGSHIVIVSNGTIYHAKIAQENETTLYQDISDQAAAFGFTKTLRCKRNGTKPLAEYLRDFWPKLSLYAKQEGYTIVFTKDTLATEQAVFRADFSADLNIENDWLYFDVDCYCGEERVTLEKLLAYLESGQSLWRKDDGILVEISNRQELERLAKLLKSFHARENGGFEGRLHHAPELKYVMTSSRHYNLTRAKSFERFMSRVEEGKPLRKVRLPSALAQILRPYQKQGIEWLYFLRSYHFAGILADDMGLGKTLQALTILFLEKVIGNPSVVVCPKTLLYNWKLEAGKFFPKMKVLVYEGTPLEREAMQSTMNEYDLILVGYGTLRRDEAVFSQSTRRFNYVVLDEAQCIKNHASKSAQVVKRLNADYRLALTGTPLENSVSELWSMYDFLMPGFLGNYEYFAKHFHRPIMDGGDRQVLEYLRRKVASFMLRRTKSEVLKDLPPKIETLSQCHLSEAQNVLYQQILAKVRNDVFDVVQKKGFKSAQIHILAGLTKLRQVCNHPALLTKDKDFRQYESAKLDMCMELVDEIVENNRKVLIFSQFT